MKKAIASPARVEKCSGLFFFEVTAIEYPDGRMGCGFSGTGRTYKAAKNDFWSQWKESNPNTYLEFKLSSVR